MEERRNTQFAQRIRTRIWRELPDADNPWLATDAHCHGYAHSEMVGQLDYPQTLFLLLRGELPDAQQGELLRRFLVAFCNPGPRHGATRAAMNAAASGTRSRHLAAIGLALLGGEHLGSGEVEKAATFLARHRHADATALAASLITTGTGAEQPADRRVAPGFGTLFGGIDPQARTLAALLGAAPGSWPALAWGERFATCLREAGCGWLAPGVAAAACVDLGFSPRAAGVLYQIASLPGLLAHGLEMGRQGLQAMPFVPDEDYEFLDPRDGATPEGPPA
jgi:citrate synthase